MGVGVHSFTLEQTTRIAFGEKCVEGVTADVDSLVGPAARVLLVADAGVAAAGLVARALDALRRGGSEVTVLADLTGEPTAAAIDGAAARAREVGATVVVALGGGSALDAGKLAAAVARGEPAEAYALAARPLPADPLPVVCVPTTAGTGAEVTRTAVFSDSAGRKVWAWGEALRPRIALLDPTLTVSLPPAITAMTALDALVHAIEAATSRRAHPLADAPALHAIRLICAHLPVALQRPADLEARGGLLIAACLAGLAIDAAGTAIAHALGHALGTLAKVPHGRAVALSLRVALAWNVPAAPERHRAVAAAMGLSRIADERALARALAARFDALVRGAGLAVSLAGDGLGAGDADRLTDALLAAENRPMLEANARAPSPAEARALVADLLAAS
jgi:alcohol dehydrogenase class IV